MNRRTFLTLSAGVGAVSVAGCSEDGSTGTEIVSEPTEVDAATEGIGVGGWLS